MSMYNRGYPYTEEATGWKTDLMIVAFIVVCYLFPTVLVVGLVIFVTTSIFLLCNEIGDYLKTKGRD